METRWGSATTSKEIFGVLIMGLNPLTPTVATRVQLWSILCQTGFIRHL